ncbi:MAG: amidohydrolase family protein [Planctomycetota bacterium]|nr:amidohydrolase family protein [Planctomycetota bacterium]MDA1140275.1 amidohydrolase family protein [Planctomycetota bacterium]
MSIVIDADIHTVLNSNRVKEYLPEPWRTRYQDGSRGPGHLGYWNPSGVMRSDTRLEDGSRIEASPGLLIEHFFEKYGIDYGIMNTGSMHIGLSPEPDFAAAVVQAEMELLVEEWFPVSERIKSSITVSPADPALAAEQIHRFAGHDGFVQVLMPSGARIPYGNRFFHPIYEAASECGLPVAIHPGSEGVGISGPPTAAGYPGSYFEWHTSLVASYISHVSSLVIEGVFVKFPDLRFVLVEGGISWLPALLWRMDKNWKALRMTAPWLERPPSEYVTEHMLLTTQPIEEPPNSRHLHQILDMFDAENMLMFSSDFPHWDGDAPDFTARWMPENIKEKVMGRTASELYGIGV